jgi:hypothetical protein
MRLSVVELSSIYSQKNRKPYLVVALALFAAIAVVFGNLPSSEAFTATGSGIGRVYRYDGTLCV